jgi:integrase
MKLSELVSAHMEQFIQTRTKTHGEPPRPNTIIAHRNPLDRIAADFDRQYAGADQLTLNYLKDWILEYDKRAGVSAVNQVLTAVTEFLRFLRDDNNRISDADLNSWHLFQRKHYRRWKRTDPHRKYLRQHELEDLFGAMAYETPSGRQRDRDVAFFGSLLLGPSRLGELLRLNIADIAENPAGEHPAHFVLLVRADYAKDHEEHRLMIFQGATVGGIEIFTYLSRLSRMAHDPR